MQIDVARRYPRIVTVSSSSKRDITEQMASNRIASSWCPSERTTTSSGPARGGPGPRPDHDDGQRRCPLKGLVHLLEAVAKLRTERPDTHLVVIGKARPESQAGRAVARLGLGDAVEFASGSATTDWWSCTPRRRWRCAVALRRLLAPCGGGHGQRLPAGGTTGAPSRSGGHRRVSGLLVPPGDRGRWPKPSAASWTTPNWPPVWPPRPPACLERFTWRACAELTAEQYRWVIEERRPRHADRPLRAPRTAPRRPPARFGCGGGRHAYEAMRRGALVTAVDADAAEVKDVAR